MELKFDHADGYIWYSDRSTPEIYRNEALNINLATLVNPFIVEGMIKANGTSYIIKYVDGKHLISSCKIEEVKEKEETNYEDIDIYIGNRLEIIEENIRLKIKLKQNWKTVPDENCCNFDVLTPAELVFLGFGKEEKEEKQ